MNSASTDAASTEDEHPFEPARLVFFYHGKLVLQITIPEPHKTVVWELNLKSKPKLILQLFPFHFLSVLLHIPFIVYCTKGHLGSYLSSLTYALLYISMCLG